MFEFEIRKVRTAQGPKKLTRERDAYFALVDQGVGHREAARIVGVSYKTSKRWRYGRNDQTVSRPSAGRARVVWAPSSSRYLTELDRLYIADRRWEGAGVRTIAAEIGRSPSTVSREIRRNSHANGQYRPHAAHARALARRPRPKPRRLEVDDELRAIVQDLLARRWSPEQIARRLRRDFPDRPERHVTHETIYQAIYVQGRGQLRRDLARVLRTGRVLRKPHRQAQQRQSRFITPEVMISQRPAEADDRAVPGHWEGDLIIGKNNQSAIGTLVERSTRYVLLLHLPHGRSPNHVRDALVEAMRDLPAHLRRSLTWDQGIEMARHHEFTLATDIQVFFCDPHSPWQRGSNENTNGLLRQYFPKSTDLTIHNHAHLDTIAVELNGRPRKTLGWDTPAERLATLLHTTNQQPRCHDH